MTTTITTSATGRSPEAVFMRELIDAVLTHFGFAGLAPDDRNITARIEHLKGSAMCEGDLAVLNVLRFLAEQPSDVARMWAAPWRLKDETPSWALEDPTGDHKPATTPQPTQEQKRGTTAMSFAWAGRYAVRLAAGTTCRFCGRALNASDVEVGDFGMRLICVGEDCHQTIFSVEAPDRNTSEDDGETS
jgi:hypothetical protein